MQSGGWKPKLDASGLEIRGTFHRQAHEALQQLTHSSDGISPEMVCLSPTDSSGAGISGYKAVACHPQGRDRTVATALWPLKSGMLQMDG